MKHEIVLPSHPKAISEEGNTGLYQIDGLYPGYGHTLGNSLRRIILSSLPGAAITTVKIDGVQHEFSTIEGVKEDVVNILLNLKRIRVRSNSEEPVVINTTFKGEGTYKAKDLDLPGQLEIMNPDQEIVTIVKKSASLDLEITVERGLGYVSRDNLTKGKADIGLLALDAIFSPIRRVNYEVENMRVGDRTDYNRLQVFIETDGTITPREVLEESVRIMVGQLRAIMGVEEPFSFSNEEDSTGTDNSSSAIAETEEPAGSDRQELLKTRVESLNLSTRTENSLINANIRTLGGLISKSRSEILELEGIGSKALDEVEDALSKLSLEFES